MPVTFHRLAALEFVAARSPTVEARFVAAITAAVQRIDTNPASGSQWIAPIRWVRVRRYPYAIFYEEIAPSILLVYAVAHTRRRPGYWVRRTRQP
jgi:plasmid stabilization system protein ParE